MSLVSVLLGVDWLANIEAAYSSPADLQDVETALLRIAVWSKQLEEIEKGNPALSFVREMQTAAHQGAALIGLGLFKASAAASRTLVETCLYYTFFRTHSVELASLVRLDKYYVTKNDIVEYHKVHTPAFSEMQAAFGLLGSLETWYSRVSAVVHGQLPGAWNSHSALSDLKYNATVGKLALSELVQAEKLVHEFLLCSVARQIWSGVGSDAKLHLLKGLSGDKKAVLRLDKK